MKKFILIFFCLTAYWGTSQAQEAFTIEQYDIKIDIGKDASLKVTEKLNVNFSASRHGIMRMIPYQYQVQSLPKGSEKATMDMTSNGKKKTMIENISVDNWKYTVNTEGDYYNIKIGDKKEYVDGQQEYIIHYTIENAINFFSDKSELYFNLIGDKWRTSIDKVTYTVTLPEALPTEPAFFAASGYTGSRDNNTTHQWQGNRVLTGATTVPLQQEQGLTIGIVFPKGYLIQPNYFWRNVKWLLLPLLVFFICYYVWKRWGKDEKLTITTEFYPPKAVSPGICGYVIDDRLDKRDLTALIPYWGGEGYLQVKESESESLLGLIKNKEYEFIKLKDLPETAMSFEKTLFNGIFAAGDKVLLSSLKNVLYSTMTTAKKELEAAVDRGAYYTKDSRGLGAGMVGFGILIVLFGGYQLFTHWGFGIWQNLSIALSGIMLVFFGTVMAKKTKKGNELYQKLAGFKEFIQKVEQPRLAQFLKEDEHYFDKVLPFAIVFDVADKWKDKLKDLDVPPPNWYVGNYHGFTTYMFLTSLDHSMNQMSENFYSTPSSSGSSGGSWSGGGGGGGFSGGGFGGGGGSSW